MKRLLAVLLFAAAASAQTTTSVTTTLPTGQTVTIPVTVTLGSPVVSAPPVTTPPVTTPPTTTGTAVPLSAVSLGVNANLNGFIPANTPEFITDISTLPVDTTHNSQFIKNFTAGGVDHLRLDPTVTYFIYSSKATPQTINFTSLTYADESDGTRFPYFTTADIELGTDDHVLALDRDTGDLWEAFGVEQDKGATTWNAGSTALWNVTRTTRRPNGWTSADAAGLAIMPMLQKYNEAAAGPVMHATRFTTNNSNSQYFPPATHSSGGGTPAWPAMVLRLKSTVDVTKYSKITQNILYGYRHFGLVWADNGSNMFVTADSDPRWSNTVTNAKGQSTTVNEELGTLSENDFEMVNTGRALQNPPQ